MDAGDTRNGPPRRRDILAEVAHDLRSPLNAIVISAARLRKIASEPQQQAMAQCLDIVESSTTHMQYLIDELLELSSIENHGLSLELSHVAIADIIDAALEMLRGSAQAKQISVDAPVPAGLELLCDRSRLIRVLTNLVGNALKYTPTGGHVCVTSGSGAGLLWVKVVDSGPGVPAEQQTKLFEPYWRGQKSGRGGMGLGLSIARKIVSAHGGHIWVESKPGQGSAFCFTIPQAEDTLRKRTGHSALSSLPKVRTSP